MRKKPSLVNILIIVFTGLLSTLGGILSSIASSNIPPVVKPYLGLAWPLLGIVALLLIVLTVWQTVLRPNDEPPTPAMNSQKRQRMLARVHDFWIKGVLEQSLHRAALIALRLSERQDAIANPWHLVISQPDHSMQSLPPGTRITEAYDKANGELLILGEPGSGKTTLLLELTRDLIERAKKDDTELMPIVFNLSSWAVKHQPLPDWLVEELNTKYQVPRKLAELWVNDDQILPLLDGLDEVEEKHRETCIGAINDFHKEHMTPMVVCSRSREYLAQSTRLSLQSAVMLQKLTAQQIDDYLWSTGSQLEAVRAALHNDPDLLNLAETPLMLSVLTLAYYGKSVEDLLATPLAERQRQAFTKYVERMLQRRRIVTRYSKQQTVNWLTWLAKELKLHSQTEFYIERMQPDWLPDNRLHRLYIDIAIRLMGGIFGGLTLGLLCGLSGFLIGEQLGGNHTALIIALVSGLGFGLIGALGLGMLINEKNSIIEIEPAEVIVRSKVNPQRSWIKSLMIGLVLGIVVGLVLELAGWLRKDIFNVLFFGLAFMIFYAVFFGPGIRFSSKRGDSHSFVKPNEGIWRSGYHSLYAMLFFGFCYGLFFGLMIGLFSGKLLYGLIGGVTFGVGCAMISGLFGGAAFIQHFVLRMILWRTGYAPLNYPRFLDYATDHILLRKVGGGYIFIHRLLLEYFASLDDVPIASKVADQIQDSTSAS